MTSTTDNVEPAHVPEMKVTADVGDITTHRPGEAVDVPDENPMAIYNGPTLTQISSFWDRFLLIKTGTLQGTDSTFTDLLASSFDLWAQYFNNTLVAKKLANFAMFRCGMEVIFTVTPPSNAYGLYLLQAIPEGGESLVGSSYVNSNNTDNAYTATQGVHAFVDITSGNSVSFKLPWVYQQPYCLVSNTSSYVNSWRLCLWPLQAIANAVNSDAIVCTYNIYARPISMDLRVASFQGKKEGAAAPQESGIMARLKKGKATVDRLRESKSISSGLTKVAQMGAMASSIPFLAPFAAPIGAGAAALASFASSFGFTREAEPTKPMTISARPFSSLMHVDGTDGSEIVGLLQSNTVTIDPTIGGGSAEDEESFASLFKRWTIISTFVWSTADAVGTIEATYPVTPFYCANFLGVMYPIVGGFIAFPFQWWRGSMEYKIIIPSSVYHRGMLQVYWSSVAVSIGSTDPTQVLYNEIFDVEAGSEYTFRIGWNQQVPMLQNNGLSYAGAASTMYSNGFIYFRVVSQLQAVGGTAPITCVLMARVTDDFEFGMPKTTDKFLSDSGSTTAAGYAYTFQGKNVGDEEDGQDDEIFDLVPNSGPYPCLAIHIGEKISSVRALMQKFSLIDIPSLSSAQITGVYNPSYPSPATYGTAGTVWFDGAAATQAPWTWTGYYSVMFTGRRGSQRYKVTSAGPTITSIGMLSDFAQNHTLITNTSRAFTTSIQNVGSASIAIQNTNTGGAEFTVPYYDSRLWRSCVYPDIVTSGSTRVDYMVSPSSTGTFYVYVAAGPDTTMIRFRRTPGLITHP
jgi:hypothetical protein